LQCGQTLAHSLGTLVCQVVGFTSKPEGFDMKRLYRLERALWNALGRLVLLWQKERRKCRMNGGEITEEDKEKDEWSKNRSQVAETESE